MLDYMRKRAKSRVIWIIFGAIIVVFVFWGVWTPHGDRERDLLKIGNQTITVTEVRNHYQRLRDQYQMIYRDRFTDEMAKRLGLKERAVKDLIDKVLLLQEAKRLGLSVSGEELQASIEKYPAFQKDGVFDRATYASVLQRNRLNPKDFELGQSQMLLISKVRNLIVFSTAVTDQEILEAYRDNFEKINLEVLAFNPAEMKEITIGPEEAKEYFSKHREDFKIPTKVKARYLLLNPADYSKQVSLTPKEIEDYYQNNQEKFGQPKRVKVRHILIRADAKDAEASAVARKKAESLREELVKGKDFARLAKQSSEDPGTKDRGGELGYVSRGQLVPEFEQAAFSLKVGEISSVIQTPYGFHILRVDDIQEAKTDSLEQAKGRIEALLRNRKAKEIAHDAADQAFAVAMKEKQLDGFAKERNLPLKDTTLFSAEDKVELDPKLKDAALSLNKGEVSPVLRVGEMFAVLQVMERVEGRIPELKEVEGKVQEALRREKQKEKAISKAKEVLEKLKKGGELKSLAAHEGFKIEETGFFERGSSPPKLGYSEDLRKAISGLGQKDAYAENPLLLNDRVVILHLKSRQDFDQAQYNTQKENFRRALLQQKQDRVLENYLEDLLKKAKEKGEYKEIRNLSEAI
jgi:peptidyl-prolyl cis-trans isomerase D